MSKVSHSDCAVDCRMGLTELKSRCYDKPRSRMTLDVHNPQVHSSQNSQRVLSPCPSPSCQMEKIVEMDIQELSQSPTYGPHFNRQQVYSLQTPEEIDLSHIPCYDYDSVNCDCENRDFYSSGFQRQILDTDKYSLGYESGNYGSDMSKYTPEYEMSRFDLVRHQCAASTCCSDNMSTLRSCEKLKLEQDTGFSEGNASCNGTSHSCEKLRPVDDVESHDSYLYNSMKVGKLDSPSRRGATLVGILWTLVSILVAGTCSFSFLQPFWFVQPETLDSFGMFSYCIQNRHLHRHHTRMMQACGIYGGKFHFSNLPSHAWQAACVLYGGGCAMQCLGALLAICSLCMPRTCYKKLSNVSGYIQLMSVLIMVAGLFVFPLGLNSRFFQYYCGKSGMYDAGDCELGWGYLLGIMGTAISMFCPFLSQYTDMKVFDSYV